MKQSVLVRGRGVAAFCCLQLLQEQAARADAGEGKSGGLPAMLISPATQNLLADVFKTSDLFQGMHQIRSRIVSWGNGGGEPVTLPHSGLVGSERVLLDRMAARLPARSTENTPAAEWTIVTAKPPTELVPEMRFGTRTARVCEVALAAGAETDACWVESVESGWLFLLATGAAKGSLIAVGGQCEELLSNSRLVSRQMRKICQGTATEFPAYPRILSKLCGEGWLACGSAAMAFDPLCGEGAGNAGREAILACAAARAILEGEAATEVLQEYSVRLLLGFLRHLENCREFYRRAATGEFWSSELARIEEGIAWAKAHLASAPSPKFKLVNFALERIAYAENA